MRFWLSRDTSIPIREQLSAQLILGILSRRLGPGQRLPSVRELARRLKIHANTVSAAYQDLSTRGWVTRRAGAGIFVTDRAALYPDDTIEAFAAQCVQDGLARGFSESDLQAAFANAIPVSKPGKLIVVDPEIAMGRLLAAEIEEALGVPVAVANLDDIGTLSADARLLANQAHTARLHALTPHRRFEAIQLKSMEDVVAGHQRPDRPVLIGVVTQSKSILDWASTLLSALGFPTDAILLRSTADSGWREGLHACDIVAVDILTARMLPAGLPVAVFRIVSDTFLARLKEDVTAHEP
jgi:DNA-binding transcriptional regulator YhcF (GntR family)